MFTVLSATLAGATATDCSCCAATLPCASISRVRSTTRAALLTVVAHPCAHLHLRPARRDRRRLRIDSGRAVVHQIEVHLPGEDEAYRAIQTAVHEEVSRKRQHVGGRASQRGFRVVDLHRKRVLLAGLQCGRAIQAKAREASLVCAKHGSVQPDGRDAACGVELQKALHAGRRSPAA